MASSPEMFIEIGKIVGSGILGGIIGAKANDFFARARERSNGIATRKRDFLMFMQTWRSEVDRWHFERGGFARDQSAFFDLIGTFRGHCEMIKNDFSGNQKARFIILVDSVANQGTGRYAYDHDKLMKGFDDILAFVDK